MLICGDFTGGYDFCVVKSGLMSLYREFAACDLRHALSAARTSWICILGRF